MDKVISLLWEHNAFTFHFNIINNITMEVFNIHVTLPFSQKRWASASKVSPDLHTYWGFYSSLNTLSKIFLALFAPNTIMESIVMTEIQTRVNALCSHRRDISLCIILRHAITLKETITLLEYTRISVLKWLGNSPEMNSYRERFEYNDERD